MAVVVQNFINRDPQSLFTVEEGLTETYFAQTMKFIQRILVINSNSNHKQDGVVILRVLISLFENLPG